MISWYKTFTACGRSVGARRRSRPSGRRNWTVMMPKNQTRAICVVILGSYFFRIGCKMTDYLRTISSLSVNCR
jgi:hypothetical protein